MNLYIIVEGNRTELNVYPSWITLLAPQLKRIDDAWDVYENNYYIFSGGGIPSIYDHIIHSIEDINSISATQRNAYDYLVVCIDTEGTSREDIENHIEQDMRNKRIFLQNTKLFVCEQRVCMETWFLGNRRIFKQNPQSQFYRQCIKYFDISKNDPELMESNDPELTDAQFHYKYLREMFKERHMNYTKNCTTEVENNTFLNELICRFQDTGHLATFGRWFQFIKSLK